ncbi:hypothetical protein [Ralstonia insidiosa]|jgi:hypothetical protein|nr:hypothetical protein [Ralstonia insidiosa]MBA9940535.1 hypothetical protein [Ralstonia insidiosa]MBC9969013.1 hypothetical protein [Ralstonia insidiosa]MBX3905095.1 hypothetical protein [Ralstonia insidiosa]
MKKLTLASLAVVALLSACGGGGGDGTTTGNGGSDGTGTGTVGTQKTPVNPYTGQAAPGAKTTAVTGQVFNSGATAGATVTAYVLNADGTNGTVIGTATSAADGTFSMTLSQAPYDSASYVRFVATGGTYTSSADHTVQTNGTLELVTPYITTQFNNFIITSLTHVASQRMAQVASGGGTIATAYTTGAGMVLSLIGFTNAILPSDQSAGVSYLALVPGSAGDALSAYADALNAVEAYGVQYDLPSSVSVQVLAQSQLTGTASSTLPNGNAIILGQWQSGVFNPTAPYTLGQLEATGAPPPYAEMHQFMVWEYVNADCNSGNSAPYYARFPLQAGQPNLFTSGQCPTYKNYVNTIDGKVGTNNRSHVLVTTPGYVPQTVPVVGAGS